MDDTQIAVRPYPQFRLCNLFEHGSAEFGHFVENGGAYFCLRLLVFKAPRFQLRPDDRLPAPDLRLNAATLIVTAAGLPSYAALTLIGYC